MITHERLNKLCKNDLVFEIALLAKHTDKQNHALLDHACTIIAHILFDGRERERESSCSNRTDEKRKNEQKLGITLGK